MTSADDLARLAAILQRDPDADEGAQEPQSLAALLQQELKRMQEQEAAAAAFTGFNGIPGAMEK